ncbi:hypothetical protein KIN20_027309, partial [Parelaphostrongylus tenuis]
MGNKDKVPHCIVVGSTVTGTCPVDPADMMVYVHDDRHAYEGRAYFCQPNIDLRNSHDYEHHHGELVETDVAKYSE